MVSTSLAGATVGSFTGGSLADKFGRTRTFILDAVPLALGAFLRCVLNYLDVSMHYYLIWNWHINVCSATAQDIRAMIIGRLLAGIGIGISSALVPLYISEVVICWNDCCFVQNLMLLSNVTIYLCSIGTAYVDEHFQQMNFFYFADITNWNPWNTWHC